MKRRVVSIGLIVLLAVSVWGSMPVGKVRAAGPFYSKSTATNFSILADWGTNADGTGTAPSAIDNTSEFIVANGAALTTLGGNVAIRNLTVNNGSSLTLDGTNTLTASGVGGGTITVAGVLIVAGSVTNQINCTNLTINSGGTTANNTTVGSGQPIAVSGIFTINDAGTYIHNTGRSTDIGAIKSFGYTSNFEYRGSSGGAFRTSLPYGNLRWNGTGSATPNTSSPWTVNGDLRISAGTFTLQTTGTGGVNVGGGLFVDGGTFNSSTGTGVGTVTFIASGIGAGDIQVTSGSANFQNITVNSNRVVDLLSNIVIPSGSIFTVNGILNTGTNAITGAGAFALGAGGVLGIGSPAGIDIGTTSGNVRVSGARTFDPAANYIFNGLGNQTPGSGFPTTLDDLVISTGSVLEIGTGALTVNGTITNNGTLRQTQPVNNATVQFLHIRNAANTADKYFGVDITTASNLGDTTVTVMGNQKCAEALGFPVKRCFTIDKALASGDTLKLYYTDAELQGQTETNIHVWQYAGSGTSWTEVTGTRSNDASANFVQVILNVAKAANQPYALKETTPAAVNLASFTATRAGDHTVIAWETASELHNLGFNVWRGASADAPDVRLNQQVIPSQAPGGADGFAYSYRDFDTAGEAHVYYWLEDVDLDGTITRHGPVAAAADAPTAVRLTALQANRPSPALPWVGLPAAVGLTGVGVVMGLRRYWIKRSK